MTRFPSFSYHRVCRSILTLMVVFLAACGPEFVRNEPKNLVWPSPPERPRIQYIQSIYNEDDIGRVYSLKEKIFGKEYVDAFERPYGIFARRGDKLYVTDLTLRALFIFDFTIKRMSLAGARVGLGSPSGVATDSEGNIYVTDPATARIVVFDDHYEPKKIFRFKDRRIVSLAINETLGRIYVVDRNDHEVLILDMDGNQLKVFGGVGMKNGQFNYPLSVAVDRSGNVYVLDSGNFRVQIFDADGNFISKFGSVGDRPGNFANPKGIAIDSDGHIYVTDGAFSNFQIFDRTGQVLLYVGGLGPNPGQFHLPGEISIDDHDRIYVADQLNKRVEIFQYLKSP